MAIQRWIIDVGKKEYSALMLYTELEAVRHNNSFTYSLIVDETLQLKTLFLPPMLIQPLIENAVLHGVLGNRREDAHIEVTLKRTADNLRVTVTDNGIGVENSHKITRKPISL